MSDIGCIYFKQLEAPVCNPHVAQEEIYNFLIPVANQTPHIYIYIYIYIHKASRAGYEVLGEGEGEWERGISLCLTCSPLVSLGLTWSVNAMSMAPSSPVNRPECISIAISHEALLHANQTQAGPTSTESGIPS